MPIFNDMSYAGSVMGHVFDANAVAMSPIATANVHLLDSNKSVLSTVTMPAGTAGWEAFGQVGTCADSTTLSEGVQGVQNIAAIDFGVTLVDLAVKYIGVGSTVNPTTSIFLVELTTTKTFSAGDGVVIAAAELKLGFESYV